MNIEVICADCGRHIGTFVRLGKKKDTIVEIHACYHKDTYDHIQEQAQRIKRLEAALQEIVVESGDIEKNKWPTQQQKCFAIAQQALKGG